jgi:2-dehydropantoate 2-reductase
VDHTISHTAVGNVPGFLPLLGPVTSVGGVGAVTRAAIGVTRAMPETRRLLEQCMNEVFAVARSRDIALADSMVADSMAFIDTLAADGTASLQRDIIDGKPSELEYWNGAVVRLAREQGVAAPTNEFIYHSLLPQERRARDIDASSPLRAVVPAPSRGTVFGR